MLHSFKNGGLPQLTGFAGKYEDSFFAHDLANRVALCGVVTDRIGPQGQDGLRYMMTFAWQPNGEEHYISSGNLITFDERTRRLIFIKNDRSHYHKSHIEDENGWIVRCPIPGRPHDYAELHDHIETLMEKSLARAPGEKADTDRNDHHHLLMMMDYSWAGRLDYRPTPSHHSRGALDYIPDEVEQEFFDLFVMDAKQHVREFLESIDPEAAECFLADDYDPEIFNWMIQPSSPAIRARRCQAVRDGGAYARMLFKRVETGDRIMRPAFLWPNEDLTKYIDSGDDIFTALSRHTGASANFLRDNQESLHNFMQNIRQEALPWLHVIEMFPWLSFEFPPAEYPGIIFENSSYCGFLLNTIDRYIKDIKGSAQIRAGILMQAVKPQLPDQMAPGQKITIDWEQAGIHLGTMHDQMKDILYTMRNHGAQLVKHVVAPALLFRKWRDTGTISEADFEPTLNPPDGLMDRITDAFGITGFMNIDQFRQVDGYVRQFSAYALNEDPALASDPFFKQFGFRLTDTETQEGIFQLYRDLPFAGVWPANVGIREFLQVAGILPDTSAKNTPGEGKRVLALG